MVAIQLSLTIAFTQLLHEVASTCLPTDELGCLNGEAFNRSTQFVCGAARCDTSYQNCEPAVYQWATTSCCAQGIAFDKDNNFCCYEGVHANSVGVCKPWSSDFPLSCNCYSGVDRRLSGAQGSSQIGSDPNVVDTKMPTAQPCSGPLPTEGCLNGYLYDYSTQMPCGDYLVNVQSHGCCTTAEGIKPYNLQTQSCCKFGASNEVFEGSRACTCSKCTTTTTTSTSTTSTTTTSTTSTSTTSTSTTTTRNGTTLEATTSMLQTTVSSVSSSSIMPVSTSPIAETEVSPGTDGSNTVADKAEGPSLSGVRARVASAVLLQFALVSNLYRMF